MWEFFSNRYTYRVNFTAMWLKTQIDHSHRYIWIKNGYLYYSPDYNDCEIWGICDQLCEDRPGTHHCGCADGYFLEQGHICKANVSGTEGYASQHFILYDLLLQDLWGIWKLRMTQLSRLSRNHTNAHINANSIDLGHKSIWLLRTLFSNTFSKSLFV